MIAHLTLAHCSHLGHIYGIMTKEILDAEIKTRLPMKLRKTLVNIAHRECLELSDIARRAFREFASKFNAKSTATKSQTHGRASG